MNHKEIGVGCFCCDKPLTVGERLYSISILRQHLEAHPEHGSIVSVSDAEGLFTACEGCKRLKRPTNVLDRLITERLPAPEEASHGKPTPAINDETRSCALCGGHIPFGSTFITIDHSDEMWAADDAVTILHCDSVFCACLSCSDERKILAAARKLAELLAEQGGVMEGGAA